MMEDDESWEEYRQRKKEERQPSELAKAAASFVASVIVSALRLLESIFRAIFNILGSLARV